jgi:hypothetical protein
VSPAGWRAEVVGVCATIATLMCSDVNRMWTELLKTESLTKVSAPILYFTPQDGQALPTTWEVGDTYALTLSAFRVLPLGRHVIEVKVLDAQAHEIYTHEHGSLARVWNHRIRLGARNGTTFEYTDQIEIHSGVLTPLIWLFAHVFYRHRQRRWKALLAGL